MTIYSALVSQAQPTAAPQGMDWGTILGLVLMFLVFYLFIIRPQGQKVKKHQEFVNSLQKGDEVITQAGIFGKIHSIADNIVTLEVDQNVKIRVERQTVASKAPSGVEKAKSSVAAVAGR